MYGENLGTGTLKKQLARLAADIRGGDAYGRGTVVEACRELMEGATVLWERVVEDEQADLRELVRTMAYCMQDGSECDGCTMNGGHMPLRLPETFACDGLRGRLIELGVADE